VEHDVVLDSAPVSSIVLTERQQFALDDIRDWMSQPYDGNPYVIHGFAGTGKSTLMGKILQEVSMPGLALMAPTGKAAKVLSSKTGKKATTIHKFLYKPVEDELSELQEQLGQLHAERDHAELDDAIARYDDLIKTVDARIKELTDDGAGEDLRFMYRGPKEGTQTIVVDETSMVAADIMEDLLELNIRMILMGDPGQLTPVKAKAGWDGMEPNVFLDQIVRTTGAGSGINLAAQAIRKNRAYHNGEGFQIFDRGQLTWDQYLEADLVLCGRNKLRQALNKGIRKKLGFTSPYPSPGEPVICLGNNPQFDIVNGEILTLVELDNTKRQIWSGWFRSDDDKVKHIKFWSPLFEDDQARTYVPAGIAMLTHARCLTVHKAQGSEANRVVVCDDWTGSDYDKWLYTGVTRGKSHVSLVRSV